jgi:hypothetical protein
VSKSGLCTLLSESKFLSADSLQALLLVISSITEHHTLANSSNDNSNKENVAEFEGFYAVLRAASPSNQLASAVSLSSAAWLELVLVELALRNRDRFQSCWPALQQHYLRSLGTSNTGGIKLSYVCER